MKAITLLAMFASLVLFGRPAAADVTWDSKGWVQLGERDVDGRLDKDTIAVGAYEGKFSKLTLVVDKSDLELLDFEITFGNGQKHNPNVRHTFKEGARTRVLDLPGDERVIKSIALRYKNLAGGGRARVQVWGWRTEGLGAGTPAAVAWDSKGWTKLGERAVNGRVDKDRITVKRAKGTFQKLTVVVLDSDLDLLDFEVKFGRGPVWNPNVKHTFKEGQRTRVLDFPGDERVIKYIHLKYANIAGGGKAKVQVWAK
ncbi:MAG: hypothetical protein H0X17_06270 [Deltaproteobacteria bacterium]|nr:hypothetical protein [Deltaproteobacteria bacterium]